MRKLDELLPLRDPYGNSFWYVEKREEGFAELKERLREYVGS